MPKLRTIIKIHGGKHFLSDWLQDHVPADINNRRVFDVCGGAGTFLLRLPRCREETYNDIDQGLVSLMRAITTDGKRLIEQVSDLEYAEQVFQTHHQQVTDDQFERGLRELVVRRMSRGGLGKHFSYSQRLRGGQPGDVNAWETWKKQLPLIVERMKGVSVRSQDACDLITEQDGADAFFFIDPPYLPSTRTMKKAYNKEMSYEDHERLGSVLSDIKGLAMVCGYDNELYSDMFAGWRCYQKLMPNHAGQTKKKNSTAGKRAARVRTYSAASR